MLQKSFFEQVGHSFYPQRSKHISQQRSRLDRRTAVRLRDMPETISRHPIYDVGFLHCALALAELAEQKGLDERNIAAELVSELMDLKIGLTNRRLIQELKEERKKLDLLIKRGDREAEV